MTEQQKTKKYKIPYLRLVIIFTVLIALIGIYTVCIYAPPLRISEETTRITGPLTADGQIDFFRYIEEATYPPEIATDENGARIFVRTFGDYGDIASRNEFYKEQRYTKLGLDRSVLPTMVFPEEPQSLLLKLDPTGKLTQRIKKSWTLEDVPMLTEWIADADVPLDAATEMIRKPVFFLPYLQQENCYRSGNPQNLLGMIPDNINTYRSIAKVYQARATYRIGTGNIDGAVDDVITTYQLGRKVGRKGNLFDMIVGVAIEGEANAIPIAENPNHQPTEEQLQRLLDAIDQLPPPVLREKYLEFERVIGLSAVQDVLHTGNFNSIVEPTGDNSFESFANFLILSCNQNIVYKYVNEFYDKLITEKIEWTGSSQLTLMIVENVATSSGRGMIVGEIFRGLLTPALNPEEVAHRKECVYNMKRLTLALLLYKTEHGEFPKEDWIEKVKLYLGDNIEQYLRCPSCATQKEGKTNYALVLRDSLPTDLDKLLLVELTEPVSYEHATINADDVSARTNVGSFHKDGMYAAVHNGAVMFFNVNENIEQFVNKLLAPEVEE